MPRYSDFLEEVGGLSTRKIVFRPGAKFTNPFGLTRRYRTQPHGESEWGWPGIHFGVDRSEEGEVLAPVRGYGKFEDWKGEVYGSLIFVRHWAGFEVVIGHCHPSTVSQRVKGGGEIPRGFKLAMAGDYGFSFGVHTHTEIRGDDDGNVILDQFLQDKIGSDAFKDLSTDEVKVAYHKCEKTAPWGEEEVFADYVKLRAGKGVQQMNKYRIVRLLDDGSRRTYYSSQLTLDF